MLRLEQVEQPVPGQNEVLIKVRARKRVVFPMSQPSKKDILFLRQLMARRDYRPVIDRIYALDQVAEAARYVETQQKTGNVVLLVDA